MEKSLEQLKQEYEKTTVLLEREKRKMQRLKNRQAYLESGSRKQRTHRLITRGAAVESIAPQTKELTETEFYSLMESILNRKMVSIYIKVSHMPKPNVLCRPWPLINGKASAAAVPMALLVRKASAWDGTATNRRLPSTGMTVILTRIVCG